MSWVNAQLRKKPGLNPVSDLRQDLRDGVVLAHLIEIVGKSIHHIHIAELYNVLTPAGVSEHWSNL